MRTTREAHILRTMHHARSLLAAAAFALLFPACEARRPDVAAAVLRHAGQAIAFHKQPEPVDAIAQSTSDLSPERALRLALDHDPRLQIALAKVRMAEADANQARLLPNPILNIDVRIPQQPGTNTAFEATLTGDVVSLLQKPGLISAADKRLRISAGDALSTVLDLISELQQSYAAVQSADEEIANAQARLDILQRLRTIANERLTAGEGARLDVLTLDTQLLQSSLDLDDLREQAAEERLHLARLIGQPSSAADWHLSPINPPLGELAPESAWIDLAMKSRPEIAGKVWELSALGDDLSAAYFSPFTGGELGAHTEHDPEWRTGPTLTIPLPIFDFGQASRAKIEAQRLSARHDLLEQQREIVQDIRTAWSACRHAREALLAIQNRLLPLQQQQLDQAQRAYRAGETDLTTLLQAESDNQLARAKALELREKLIVARVKLERAAGGSAIAGRLLSPDSQSQTTQPGTLPTSRPATGTAP